MRFCCCIITVVIINYYYYMIIDKNTFALLYPTPNLNINHILHPLAGAQSVLSVIMGRNI